MVIEVIRLILFAFLIVLISKYILVSTLRKLAESLNLKAKTVGDIAGVSTSIPEFLTITVYENQFKKDTYNLTLINQKNAKILKDSSKLAYITDVQNKDSIILNNYSKYYNK